MSEASWFGAKTLYRWPDSYSEAGSEGYVYEERVIVLRARDADDAIVRAEEEAVRYAKAAADGTEYLGAVDVYEMFDGVEDGAEVFSLLRSTPLAPKAFLDRYHDPDGTHSRPFGEDRDPAS
jgi:hypothetical protein